MISPDLQKLTQIPLFGGLSEREAAALFEVCEEVSLKKGETLFREGDDGDAIYAVQAGELEVTKGAGAATQVLARVGEGAVLGEMSLLGGGVARSATVAAATDARLLQISAARFSQLLKGDNVAALKIVFNLAQLMSRRLKAANEKLVEVSMKAQRKEELMDFQKILSHWSF